MKKIILAFALLAGCAQRQWVDTGPPSAFDQAYYECDRDRNMAQDGINARNQITSSDPYGRLSQRAGQLAASRRFMERCMNTKGYALR